MDPKVFYGPIKGRVERPPDSDTETEIEEAPKKFKRLHRRTDSEMDARKRPRDDVAVDISSRAGQRELVGRAATGDVNYVGLGLQMGWLPSSEAIVLAAKNGHSELLGLLLAFGSGDVEFEHVTPLKAAIIGGHIKVVQLLLSSHVNLSWRDHMHRSYADIAEKASQPVRDALLVAYKAKSDNASVAKLEKEPAKEKMAKPEANPKVGEQSLAKELPTNALASVPEEISPKHPTAATPPKAPERANSELNVVEPTAASPSSASPNSTPRSDSQPVAKEAPRKKFSLSDYKNLQSIKAKKEAEEATRLKAEKAAAKEKELKDAEILQQHLKDTSEAIARQNAKEVEDAEHRARSAREAAQEAARAKAESDAAAKAAEVKKAEEEAKAAEAKRLELGKAAEVKAAARAEAEARAKSEAEVEAKAKAEAEVEARAKAEAEAEARVRAEAEVEAAKAEAAKVSTKAEAGKAAKPKAEATAKSKHSPSPSPKALPNESAIDSPDIFTPRSREVSHSPRSPAMSPAPDDAKTVARRTEERKSMVALLQKREKERRAREALMLERLVNEEKRRQSEKEVVRSPRTAEEPAKLVLESDVKPEPMREMCSADISALPHVLQRLACTGKPQEVGPLYAYQPHGKHVRFEEDPSKFQCLDTQVGAMLGVCLHAKYPTLTKMAVPAQQKASLWEFVAGWAAPRTHGVDADKERAKFVEFPQFWLKGDEVAAIAKELGMALPVIPINLQRENAPVDMQLLGLARSLPIHLASRIRARQQAYAWE